MASIKVNVCYTVNSYKNKLNKNFKRGGGGGCRGGSAFDYYLNFMFKYGIFDSAKHEGN